MPRGVSLPQQSDERSTIGVSKQAGDRRQKGLVLAVVRGIFPGWPGQEGLSGLRAAVPRRPRHGGTWRGKASACEHPCCKE